jgi:prophage regulatory protein
MATKNISMLRKPQVLKKTGYSNSALYEKIKAGELKRGVKIGARMVAWPEEEIDQHIAQLIAKRDAQLSQEAV